MYRIMSEIAGPMRQAMMSTPDRRVDGRLDAHSDLAMLRRALQSAGLPFVEHRGEIYVAGAGGDLTLFNAFEAHEDAEALAKALHISCTRLLWLRRLTTPTGQRSTSFDDSPEEWRRAVVTFAASLPSVRS
ncbi:hypothetical protein [Paraburkholderia youngii]|uniref:hypothetical protein n=1 Tax=Paraburkholderia youngii TaxID=2782701 RepID=UPI003D227815